MKQNEKLKTMTELCESISADVSRIVNEGVSLSAEDMYQKYSKMIADAILGKYDKQQVADIQQYLKSLEPQQIVYSLRQNIEKRDSSDLLDRSIDVLFKQKGRLYQELINHGYKTVGDIYNAKKKDIINVPGAGQRFV